MTVPTSNTPNDSGQQRVTLAVVAVKIDHLIESVQELVKRFDAHGVRIDALEKHAITCDGTLGNLQRTMRWVGGVLAGIIITVIGGAILYYAGWRP